MSNSESIIGLIVVLLTAILIIILSSRKVRLKIPPVFRKIAAIQKLRRAIGLSVEDGRRMHVALGNASLSESSNPSALAGLSALHRLGQLSSTSDMPPVSSSGDGGFTILSKDVLHAVSLDTNTRELYNPDHGQMTGVTPFSYAVGALSIVNEPAVNANILIGNYGPEAALLTTLSEERESFTLAVSDSIVAQSVFFATTRDVMIGEELFAIPAYLAYNPVHLASLRVQDIFRLLVGIALVGGAVLKVIGIL